MAPFQREDNVRDLNINLRVIDDIDYGLEHEEDVEEVNDAEANEDAENDDEAEANEDAENDDEAESNNDADDTSNNGNDSDEMMELKASENREDAFINMVIGLMMPIRTASSLLRCLHSLTERPIQTEGVLARLLQKYNHLQEKLKPMLIELTKHKPYSLSVEFSKSQMRYKHNFDIFVHFVDNQPPYQTHCVLYDTSDVWLYNMKLEDYQRKFVDFDLNNCSAVTLCGQMDYSCKDFTSMFAEYKIPIVPSIEHLVNRYLKSMIRLPVMRTAFRKLHIIIDKNPMFYGDDVTECFWSSGWSQLNFFEEYFKKCPEVLKDDCETKTKGDKEFLRKMKSLIDYLTPLMMMLEISEKKSPIPRYSIMKPMLEKLFDIMEHNKPDLSTNEYVESAYNEFKKKLPPIILSSYYVRETTFFDRRFDFDCKKLKHIKKNLKTKFKNLIAKYENNGVELDINGEKTGLEKFFEKIESSNVVGGDSNRLAANNRVKSKFAIEFQNYIAEEKVGMNQCPITWWDLHKNQYKILSNIAARYLTTPCCVSGLFNLGPNESLDIAHKRNSLGEKDDNFLWTEPDPPHELDDKLWYLHYNLLHAHQDEKKEKGDKNEFI